MVRQLPEGGAAWRRAETGKHPPELELIAPDLLYSPAHDVPLARLALCLPGGTIFERTPGAAAMCAAWLLTGTRRRDEAEFWEKFEDCGAELGVVPGFNSILVSLSAPRRYFRRAVNLLGEVLREPRFGDAEFERERERLIENCRCRENSPNDAALQRARAALFGPHPYGRSFSGEEDDLRAMTPDEVRRFYREILYRDRITAAFGGDCRAAEATELRQTLFDGIEWAERPPQLPAEPRFPAKAERIDFTLPREQTAVVLALPGIRFDDRPDRQLDILRSCENGLSTRLFRRVREDNALSYSVGMTYHQGFHRGSFAFYALTGEAGAERALGLLREEVERLAEAGVDEAEFLAAREAAAFEADTALESRKSLLDSAALDHYYGMSPEWTIDRGKLLRAVTRKEFNALLRECFADALTHSVAVIARGEAAEK